MKLMKTWGAALLGAVLSAACGAAVSPVAPNVPAPRVETSPTFCNVGERTVGFTIPSSRVVDRIVVRATGEGTLLAYVAALVGSEYVKVYSSTLTSPGEVRFEGVVIPRNPSNPAPEFWVGLKNTIGVAQPVCVTIEVTSAR